MDIVIVIASVVLGITADRLYYLELGKPGHSAPNRWSWLIWSIASYMEVATFKGISHDWLKVLPLATTPIACTVLLVRVWKMNENRWENRLEMLVDLCSVVASLGAVVIWILFQEELWAHVIMVFAVPVSYIPTWRSLPKEPRKGEMTPWMIWACMDALNLALNLHRLDAVIEIPYVGVELFCHASVWFAISFRRSA